MFLLLIAKQIKQIGPTVKTTRINVVLEQTIEYSIIKTSLIIIECWFMSV